MNEDDDDHLCNVVVFHDLFLRSDHQPSYLFIFDCDIFMFSRTSIHSERNNTLRVETVFFF
jgi:hypothetical protein